jgi:hypothetical protein
VQRVLEREAKARKRDAAEVPVVEVAPLPDRHDEATAARQRAMHVFDGIDDTFADIDRRTAEILARTEALLADIGES